MLWLVSFVGHTLLHSLLNLKVPYPVLLINFIDIIIILLTAFLISCIFYGIISIIINGVLQLWYLKTSFSLC